MSKGVGKEIFRIFKKGQYAYRPIVLYIGSVSTINNGTAGGAIFSSDGNSPFEEERYLICADGFEIASF